MPYAKRVCPCGAEFRPQMAERVECSPCHAETRKPPQIQNFEPARIVDEAYPGRPFADPRNNFKFPNYNQGVPRRDMIASPIKVCVFDLETSGLNASFGRTLAGVFRFFGPDELIVHRADTYPSWKAGKRSDDSGLVLDILKTLEQADILIGHNAVNFDMKFIRARAVILGLPPVHVKKVYDPVLVARSNFRFASNRLEGINRDLNTATQKTPLTPETWARATMDGDPAAMDEIVEHCIADVDSLCETSRRFAPYVRQIDSLGSAFGR